MLNILDIKKVIEPIVKGTKVKRVVLFGSHAQGTASENSDIDLFIDSNGEITGLAYFDLKSKMEDAFAMDIDLLPDLDVIPGSRVAHQINESGVTVYERKE